MRDRWRGLGYAAIGGCLAAYILLAFTQKKPLGGTDFDQAWYAARWLLDGEDPYKKVVPPLFDFHLFYPLTAVLVSTPFALLDLPEARLLFVTLNGGIFGYAIGRWKPWLWPTFLGLPFILVASNAQWAGLLTAALFLPWLGPLAAAKPNIGLPILLGARSRRTAIILVAGGLLLLVASLAVDPLWPWKWRDALAQSTHLRPLILRPGGLLLLLALLRWRDPDARLLLALSAVPTTGLYYDFLPAAVVAQSRKESAFLALCTEIAWFSGRGYPAAESYAQSTWNAGIQTLWGALIPPLILVLWRGRGQFRLGLAGFKRKRIRTTMQENQTEV